MKISGTALPLFVFLLVASFVLVSNTADEDTKVQAEAAHSLLPDLGDLIGPDKCCHNYTSKAVPCHLLKSYFYADGQCFLHAIIFVSRKNKKICANPEDKWVQKCQRELPPPEY
uniref:C-C motif chemokine 14-like n=1 Tax=Pogona vitticeps TaxID=103695 RepID=A0ABM5ELS6_9SAUR